MRIPIRSLLLLGVLSFNTAHGQTGPSFVESAGRETKQSHAASFDDAMLPPDGARVLAPGDTIQTKAAGQRLVKYGTASMVVAGNTKLEIPRPAQDGPMPTIVQHIGSVRYLNTRTAKPIAVETPDLALTADRADFRVVVRKDRTYVDVLAGEVNVVDVRSGLSARITTAQAATVWSAPESADDRTGKADDADAVDDVASRDIAAPPTEAASPDEPDTLRGAGDLADVEQTKADAREVKQKLAFLFELSRPGAIAAASPVAGASPLLSAGVDLHLQNQSSPDPLLASEIFPRPLPALPRIGSAHEPLISGSILPAINSGAAAFDVHAIKATIGAPRTDAPRAPLPDAGATRAALAAFLAPPALADQAVQAGAAADQNDDRQTSGSQKQQTAEKGDLIPWQFGVWIVIAIAFFAAAFSRGPKQSGVSLDYNY